MEAFALGIEVNYRVIPKARRRPSGSECLGNAQKWSMIRRYLE